MVRNYKGGADPTPLQPYSHPTHHRAGDPSKTLGPHTSRGSSSPDWACHAWGTIRTWLPLTEQGKGRAKRVRGKLPPDLLREGEGTGTPVLMAQLWVRHRHRDPSLGGEYSPWPLSPLLCLPDPCGRKDPEEGKRMWGRGALGLQGACWGDRDLWGFRGTCGSEGRPVEMGGTRMGPGEPGGGSHSPSCQEAQGGQAPQKPQADPTNTEQHQDGISSCWSRRLGFRTPLSRQPPPYTTPTAAIPRLLTEVAHVPGEAPERRGKGIYRGPRHLIHLLLCPPVHSSSPIHPPNPPTSTTSSAPPLTGPPTSPGSPFSPGEPSIPCGVGRGYGGT